MKKGTCLICLLLLLCLGAAAAQAEDLETNYEGAWMPLADTGYQLYLPLGWNPGSRGGDVVFAAKGPAASFQVTCKESGGKGLEGVLVDLKAQGGRQDVKAITYNRRNFITYTVTDGGAFGAATLSTDGEHAFFFTFTPGDEATRQLAQKILSSFSPNQ